MPVRGLHEVWGSHTHCPPKQMSPHCEHGAPLVIGHPLTKFCLPSGGQAPLLDELDELAPPDPPTPPLDDVLGPTPLLLDEVVIPPVPPLVSPPAPLDEPLAEPLCPPLPPTVQAAKIKRGEATRAASERTLGMRGLPVLSASVAGWASGIRPNRQKQAERRANLRNASMPRFVSTRFSSRLNIVITEREGA